MLSQSPLTVMLVAGFGLAFVLGTLAHRFRISPIVAYLAAGVVVGPFTQGLVADQRLAAQLADVGVMLLMFGVGLHFTLKDLSAVRALAVPGAIAQMFATAALGACVAWLAGWGGGAAIVYGLALSVSSTVVITRSLQNRHLTDTARGHVIVGWLVVQDIVTVMALVLLPAAFGRELAGMELVESLGVALGKVAIFIATMLLIGRRLIPWILHYVAHTGSRELFRLAVLSVALGVAFAAAELFGVSFALGAFFAGMVLSESELSQRAAEETLPLRDAFAVLFFMSVGMLFDPAAILANAGALVLTLACVVLGNGGVAYVLTRLSGRSRADALSIAVGLAQIGEFSFVLAALGADLGVLEETARNVILGASIISIFLNPFIFSWVESMRPRLEPPPPGEPVRPPEEEYKPTDAADHAIVVGYGRVGRLLGENLKRDGWRLVVIENAEDIVENLRMEGIEVIAGNAAEGRALMAANLPGARLLAVAIPDGFEAGQIVHQARAVNPALPIIARAHFDAEVEHLRSHGATIIVMGEREIAKTMLEHARLTEHARPLR
jgi:monovalent cation:H+ antiporter-2, CPA2 family